MDKFIFYILIPGLTLALPGQSNWLESNFSVAGSTFPRNILLTIWAVIVARFYHSFVKRIIGQTVPYTNLNNALVLTDLSACFLVGCTFLPYTPEQTPMVSFLHLTMAFSSTVMFYTALTIISLNLYFLAPDLFSFPTATLLYAIAGTFSILTLADFLISSALEIYLTIHSCFWLQLLERRVTRFTDQQALKTYISATVPLEFK